MTEFQHDKIVPFKESQLGKKQQVAEMFNKIAFRYDFMNRFLSAGIDIGWRKKAIKKLKDLKPKKILDVATGTADMAILANKILHPSSIIGIDISDGMLDIGREKIVQAGLTSKIELLNGDSETIKFDNEAFDAVTVAFGVRNFENLEKGLSEIRRVLRPGGRLVVLEFSKPKLPGIRNLYNLYMNLVAPQIGKMISKNKDAYQYLNDSVQKFPEGKHFVDILTRSGFKNTSCKTLSLGICSIYCGEK